MKKVLLLGDSIRMGYDDYVKDMLKDKCEVYFSEENGRFASFTVWQANNMIRKYGNFDIVHWNNGYWDMNIESPMTEAIHPLGEYLHFLRRIARLLKGCGSKVIFATTTPILESGEAIDEQTRARIKYSNEWVKTYNSAAKLLMAEEKIEINDLYELCLEDKLYYKCPDMLHLTEEGYKRCAEQVCEHIIKYLD